MSQKRFKKKDQISKKELDVEIALAKEDVIKTISIPKDIHLYNTGDQKLTSSFSAVKWHSLVLLDDAFTFEPGDTTITLTKTGWYKIVCELSIDNRSGSRCNSESGVFVNDSLLDGSVMYGYHRNSAQGKMSMTSTRITSLQVDDTITIKTRKQSGKGTLETIGNGCRLTIEEII